jgi:hypothetical protein
MAYVVEKLGLILAGIMRERVEKEKNLITY